MSAALMALPSGRAFGPPSRQRHQRKGSAWGVSVLNRYPTKICISFESPLTNFARASVGLEGFKPSPECEAQAVRFINGEIEISDVIESINEQAQR